MKKSKKKDVIINVKPFAVKSRTFEKGFELSFYSPIKGAGNRRKIINVKFDRWWVIYLAKELKKIIESEKKELERIIDLTGFREEDE